MLKSKWFSLLLLSQIILITFSCSQATNTTNVDENDNKAPNALTNIKFEKSSSSVTISWDYIENATSYKIYRADDSLEVCSLFKSVNASDTIISSTRSGVTINNLSSRKLYIFRIGACNEYGETKTKEYNCFIE